MYRFILDNDGSNFFLGTMTEDIPDSIAETVQETPGELTTIMICVNGATRFYPTQTGDMWKGEHPLSAALKRGIDPMRLLLEAYHTAGKELFLTCRMNDVHNANEPDNPNVPSFKKAHPDYIVGKEAVRQGSQQWMDYCFDYTIPEVQEYFLAMIRELLDLYGDVIDGIQLDWMRFPHHLPGSREEAWGNRSALTGFVEKVRQILDNGNKKWLLSARVPTTPAGCRNLGVDIAVWARRGLVDMLIATPFLVSDNDIPIGALRSLLGDVPVPLYADIEFGHGIQQHNPESLRATALSLYDQGADGLYLFNFPCWQEYLSARPYHWLADLAAPGSAARKPLLFSVKDQLHRIEKIDMPAQLPHDLQPGQTAVFTLFLPAKALPAWRCLVHVDAGGDITLQVNDTPGRDLPSQRRSELFIEYTTDPAPWQPARPEGANVRVFKVAVNALHPGENTITIQNTSEKSQHIRRINLGLL